MHPMNTNKEDATVVTTDEASMPRKGEPPNGAITTPCPNEPRDIGAFITPLDEEWKFSKY